MQNSTFCPKILSSYMPVSAKLGGAATSEKKTIKLSHVSVFKRPLFICFFFYLFLGSHTACASRQILTSYTLYDMIHVTMCL